MWFDAVVSQDVCDQVVFGGVGLLTHATLPPLLVSPHVDVVTVVHMDVNAKFLCTGGPAARRSLSTVMSGTRALSWVERCRGEVHDRAGHEEGVREEAVVERWEERRVEEERGWRPHWGGAEGFLFHLQGQIHAR